MAKNNVRIGAKFDNIATLKRELQSKLDSVSKSLKIKINQVDIGDIEKSLLQLNKKIDQLSKNNINIKPNMDMGKASSDLDSYVANVRSKVSQINKEFGQISKLTVKTDGNGGVVGAKVITDIGTANQKVMEFNKNLQLIGGAYTQNDGKARRMFEQQNKYLDSAIQKLNIYKKTAETTGGGRPTTQGNLINAIDTQIRKLQELKNANTQLGQAEKARINETVNAMRSQTAELSKYKSSFSGALKNVANYAIGGSLIYGGVEQIRQGINDIISLDTAMRDLRKVAKATDEQLDGFVVTANKMAISVGHTTEGAIQATEYYSKLGYAIEEASERAKQAMIFSNVSDMGIDDASKALITVQKGFDLKSVEDMTHVMDAYNEVGNNFSSSSQDIAQGIEQMGNVLYEAGNSLEETIGIFVAGNASIQDADKVGNGLKTITMRLRGMETEIDETSIPVSKLRDEIMQLTNSAGQMVDIMYDENTFKSTYDILTELSTVYPKLTDGQRAYLQYVIAGQRQGDREVSSPYVEKSA